jgi:hypothetical protein
MICRVKCGGLTFAGPTGLRLPGCYKHWAANLQTMVPGVSLELITYGLAMASSFLFELPPTSTSFISFHLSTFLLTYLYLKVYYL